MPLYYDDRNVNSLVQKDADCREFEHIKIVYNSTLHCIDIIDEIGALMKNRGIEIEKIKIPDCSFCQKGRLEGIYFNMREISKVLINIKEALDENIPTEIELKQQREFLKSVKEIQKGFSTLLGSPLKTP